MANRRRSGNRNRRTRRRGALHIAGGLLLELLGLIALLAAVSASGRGPWMDVQTPEKSAGAETRRHGGDNATRSAWQFSALARQPGPDWRLPSGNR